jgi:hypothetical protein
MNGPLTIAAITAMLKRRLENELIARGIAASISGDVVVTALPPDRVATGADERAQLNLFLWQIAPNTGLVRPGRSDLKERSGCALRLDLHYLLSAYGAKDLQSDILLAYAVQVLHNISITRDALERAVSSLADSNQVAGIPATITQVMPTPSEQLDLVTVSPQFLSMEEMARIWSATQAHYRPSAAYKVSLVPIDLCHDDDRA